MLLSKNGLLLILEAAPFLNSRYSHTRAFHLDQINRNDQFQFPASMRKSSVKLY